MPTLSKPATADVAGRTAVVSPTTAADDLIIRARDLQAAMFQRMAGRLRRYLARVFRQPAGGIATRCGRGGSHPLTQH